MGFNVGENIILKNFFREIKGKIEKIEIVKTDCLINGIFDSTFLLIKNDKGRIKKIHYNDGDLIYYKVIKE